MAWACFDPKSTPPGDTEKKQKGTTLFSGGFLEKAIKWMEEKALAKVMRSTHSKRPAPKCHRLNCNPNNPFFWRRAPLQGMETGPEAPKVVPPTTKVCQTIQATPRWKRQEPRSAVAELTQETVCMHTNTVTLHTTFYQLFLVPLYMAYPAFSLQVVCHIV